jgi:hypothetical protein
MTESQSNWGTEKSGTSAAIVIVGVLLLLLLLLCTAGLWFVGGLLFTQLQTPQPIALPPVPGANAPLPGTTAIPGATITVNEMKWSGNLINAAEDVLTLEKYDRVQPGMTYDEVLTVLSIPENRRPPDMELIGPQSDVELKWFGGPGDAQSITVKMKGKVVIDKDQSGLQ